MRARVLVVVVLALLGCTRPAGPGGRGLVVEVIDGDTIVVAVGGREERVRLIGIDTPEVHVDAGEQPECYGPEASAAAAELVPPGTAVDLVRDVVGRDDYGRLLAYVSLAADGRMVNELLVAEGFATPLSIPPNTAHARRFVAAARAAEAAGLGLWAACGG